MDYDGDGKPNPTIFRYGTWWRRATARTGAERPGRRLTSSPGDDNGDGRTELNLFRPSTGNYFVLDTASGTYTPIYNFGQAGDIAAPADYDGDGKTDCAFFAFERHLVRVRPQHQLGQYHPMGHERRHPLARRLRW